MNGYELSRAWFDFAFENPEKVKPIHAAIYFFAVEHCNRLGGKDKFGFPSQMTMDAIGVRKYQTYGEALTDLEDWGFITFIERSRNQYSANIITINAVPKNGKARGKALDKATIKHGAKQGQSTGQGMDSIDKPLTIEPLTINQEKATHSFFESEELNDVFSKWLYACANEVKPMVRKAHGQSAIEALAMKLNRMPVDKAIRQVRQSLENGWVTLRPVEDLQNGREFETEADRAAREFMETVKAYNTHKTLYGEESANEKFNMTNGNVQSSIDNKRIA